ncbi:MAG: formylmethanofuran dehydrogenase subunit B [Pirellulales bacterium]
MADQAPPTSGIPEANSGSAGRRDGERTIPASICLGCGCLCDDIDVVVAPDPAGHEQIAAARRACELGEKWFAVGQQREPAAQACRIAGQPATFDTAIERAAEILAAAQAPLIVGLAYSSTATIRSALALAEQLGASIDSMTGLRHAPAVLAAQAIGEVTCTWGEIAARSDLVVCWGGDPATTHPRHFERYSLEPASRFLPGGRAERRFIVIDDQRTATAELADDFIHLQSGSDFDALWVLRALIQGIEIEADVAQRATEVPLPTWLALAEQMKQARYGAMLFGERLERLSLAHLTIEALLLLVRELNDHTRFVAHGFGSPGNAAGCDETFTWTTGYPFAVDFARGFPRYDPDDGRAARRLARGEVDCVLTIGNDAIAALLSAAADHLRKLPLVVLDWRETATRSAATVAFRTAQPGVAAGGTVYRSDGVPLALRPSLASTEPTELEVLAALSRRVAELRKASP